MAKRGRSSEENEEDKKVKVTRDALQKSLRLFRFINESTTDDHAMHVLGYAKRANGTWFLVKDSGAGGHANPDHKGYWYMHEDYVKLKMMTATVHKGAVKELLQKVAVR